MITKAKYYISDTFYLTSRGIIFVGYIQNGVISIGDYIEFTFGKRYIFKRIKGIEMLNVLKSNKNNMGILIDCEDDSEINELKILKPSSILANICLK